MAAGRLAAPWAAPGALAAPRARGDLVAWAIDRPWLAPLLALFVVKQLVLIAIVGPFTGHDEVDHCWYIDRLAHGGGLGVVGEVQLPAAAAPYARFVADYPSNAEVIQPPLYHLLLAPLDRLAVGGPAARLLQLRLASVVLGAAVVWLAYLTARLLFPGDLLLRAGVPLFVAFQPQFAFEAAIVNHDILVIFLFSLVVYLLLVSLRRGFTPRLEVAIGLATAAGLWTKVSFGLVLPVTAAALLGAWWAGRRAWRGDRLGALHWLLGSLALTIGLPLLALSPWLIRSFLLYGDPTGSSRLHQISDYGLGASTYGRMLASLAFWQERLEDFWGNYGWRDIPLDPVFNLVLWSVWGLAGILLAALVVREGLARLLGWRPWLSRFQRVGLALHAWSLVMLIYGVLYVGTIQFTQSRFAFPGMIGFALLSLVGLDRWLPARARPAALPLLAVALVALQVVVAIRFLIPFYTGPGGGAYWWGVP